MTKIKWCEDIIEILNLVLVNDSAIYKYKTKPFYFDGYSYATNGAVIIRVPGKYDVEYISEHPNPNDLNWSILDSVVSDDGIIIPQDSIDILKKQRCSSCADRTIWADCQDCDHSFLIPLTSKCTRCHGSGIDVSVNDFELGKLLFNSQFIFLLSKIKGIKFYPDLKPGFEKEPCAAGFKFPTGDGFVMYKAKK